MKKQLLLGLALVLSAGTALAACTPAGDGSVSAAIAAAEKMSYEEILEKAKEEIGTNKLSVYGNSSALAKATAAFTELTGIAIENNKMNDVPLYQELFYTIGMNRYSADMVLIQDGNKLQTEMINPGYLLNYVPKDYKDVVPADDQQPMGAVYLNKTFMYNNTADGKVGEIKNHLTNVWQLAGTKADAKHIDYVSFKKGSAENVNMNMLIMLTSPQWVTKLEAAYKDYYGTDYVKTEKHENIGYKFIEEFLTNVKADGNFHDSDGTAVKNAAKTTTGGTLVYANFNKLKDCKEEGVGKQDPNNLTTAVIEQDGIKGFGGFVYKMYTMIPRNAKYPYAAAAFINYMLSSEGFSGAWGSDLGYYSTNPNLPIATGDKAIAWWKDNCVIEDPVFVAANYIAASKFILQFE